MSSAAPVLVVHMFSLPAAAAQALESALGALGWRCQSFESAEAWLAALPKDVPDLVLARAQTVPATAEVLDRLSVQDPRLSAVQLVALGGRDQRLPAELAGADLFLEEPNARAVAHRLRDWMRGLDRSPFRVLLIDDDPEARLFAGTVLRRVGMQVETFADADAALQRARDWRPDLVLVDLYMPGIDGLAITRRLRAEAAPQLQIVVLSGEERPQARYNALRLGVDDFLTKSVRPRVLIAAIRSRIKRSRAYGERSGEELAPTGPRLRRGDFLQRLRQRQGAASPEWRVLSALRVDGAAQLREQLGLGGTDALERALSARIEATLEPGDVYCLWEELGFGLLTERADPEALRDLLQRLLASLAGEPFTLGEKHLQLSASCGFAAPARQQADPDAERWIASAFAAVSVAAQLGGNRAEGVLSNDPDALPPERVLVIRHALEDVARGGSLRFEFQPLLRLRGERSAYALNARLRDLRAPLQGYPRREYLQIARELKQLAVLDRMCLFHAFETLGEQQRRDRACSLLVPVDLASIDARQLAWLEAEARRRPFAAAELRLEFDAQHVLSGQADDTLNRLRDGGWRLACRLKRWDTDQLHALRECPVQLLRIAHAALAGVPASTLREVVASWHQLGREWLIDEVAAVGAVSELWAAGIDYLQGEALAAASPRPDFEADAVTGS
ncbi:MAG: response regulator [Lysobacterales bacterium]